MMETRSIVVHPAAVSLRRELGAQAWSALEVLVATSEPSASTTVVMSARALAVELGVSKNTAARALVTLTAARLVALRQTRASTGTFEAGSYHLTVDAALITVDTSTPPRETAIEPAPTRTRRTTSGRHAAPVQLSLLDAS